MARPFVQDVSEHIGENRYRTDGDWIERSSRVDCLFVFPGGLHFARYDNTRRMKGTPTWQPLTNPSKPNVWLEWGTRFN